MKLLLFLLIPVSMAAIPAFAGVTISSPSNGEYVNSPFNLSATSSSCSSQSVSRMGYSIDNGDTTTVDSTSFDEQVSAAVGTHNVHVKSWGSGGAVCVADVSIDVTGSADNVAENTSVVPADAIRVSSINTLRGWYKAHDRSTDGSSSGTMKLVGSPTHSGSSREFVTHFSHSGGERYSVSFGDNTTSTNFFYDGWIYFASSASNIGNLEIDLYQVMPNGDSVIMGIQCDGYTGTWDYTENLGTIRHPRGHWAHSSAACNPRKWSRDKWHHLQASYSRSSTGRVTYKAIYLDGVEHVLNRTVLGARAEGWDPTLLTNFQVDGLGSGSNTVYLDDLSVYRW